jgi:formylglycine-generating enzyme required for sulfatase activity
MLHLMKISSHNRNNTFYSFIVLGVLLLSSPVAINWDLLLRTFHSYQNGTLTMEKFRLDLGSYNIGRNPQVVPVDTKTSPKDGMVQVLVPEGEFLMGIEKEHVFANSPQHKVYLDAFWMDRVEVTNAMYLKCIRAGGCSDPVTDNIYYNQWNYRNHPMIYVVWDQAQEYCQWVGRRLPTEAEWEKAARGVNGNNYPWGNEPPSTRLANFDETMILEAVPSYHYPLGASPYGAINMSGNVREWVADWFDKDYYTYSPYANPTGPETGKQRVLRGGSYVENWREIAVYVRYKHAPESAGLNRGFRCAQSAK